MLLEINQRKAIQNAIEEYENKLIARLHQEARLLNITLNYIFKEDNRIETNDPISKTLSITIDKYNAIQDLKTNLYTIDKQPFTEKMNKHRSTILKNQDHAGKYFLKVIATILTAGLAAAFGIFQDKDGKKLSNNIKNKLSDNPSKNDDTELVYGGL